MRKLLPFLFLLGCGGSDEPPPEVEPVPRIDLVTFPDGKEVRQGGTLRVVVEGANLERLEPTISQAETDRPSLGEWTITIDPGSPLGDRTLTLGTRSETVTVTHTYVDGTHGRDDAAGTLSAPLRSLTQVLENAYAGDRIWLNAGSYELRDFAAVEQGVVLRGAGAGETSLVFPDCGTLAVCFVVAGEMSHLTVRSLIDKALSVTGSLKDAEVLGGGVGVHVSEGGRLERVRVSGAGRGVELLGGGLTLTDVTVSDSTDEGIVTLALGGPTSAIFEAVTVERNPTGLLVAPLGHTASITARHSVFTDNGIGVRLVEDGALVDFGTAGDPGQNSFFDNDLAIRDERPARAAADGPMATFVGSEFVGADPSGVYTATSMLPVFEILYENNRLQF